jgi:transposase
LLPLRIEDYVSDDNPVRFIDTFVDYLDLQSMGFTHAILAEGAGRPSYNLGDMLNLYIWGYLNQVRSSRKLERECHRNLEVMRLINGHSPDFKTIADFRKDNVDSIRKVFREFTKLCIRLDLFSNELVGIDGTRVKAVNSRIRNFNAENLESKIKRVEERLAEYMKNMDENDKAEHLTKEELKEKIEKLKKVKEKYLSLKQELNDRKVKEVSLTDPDSRLMKLPNNGFDVCYNVQAAVDKKSHLIASYDAVNSSSDYNQLSSMAIKAKEALNAKNLTVIADMGYLDSNAKHVLIMA